MRHPARKTSRLSPVSRFPGFRPRFPGFRRIAAIGLVFVVHSDNVGDSRRHGLLQHVRRAVGFVRTRVLSGCKGGAVLLRAPFPSFP
jgi:hypothetical protein